MFRQTIVAIATAAVLSTAALVPTVASAKGGFGGGGFGGGHHGFGGVGFALGAIGAAGVAASDCWQYQLVPTPRGYYKRVLVNTCE
jgi:hypothetical protein